MPPSNRRSFILTTRTLMALALLASCFAFCRQGPRAKSASPPVILITIDTLRSDHLPAYGYRQVSTPALDRFAADSSRYERAYSNCPLTLPSHATILSGLLPPTHGVRDNVGFTFDAKQHPTLATILHKRGYATAAAVSAFVLRRSGGLAAGFDSYDDNISVVDSAAAGNLQRPGAATELLAEQWIDTHKGRPPFFYWLHLYEPHAPYDPPEPFRSRYADRYDGEVAYSDALVGRFLDFLRARGIYDRAIIVIASDHGEGLNQHGEQEHGVFLYREALQVPLLIHLPGVAGRVVREPVELADLAPSILAELGEPAGHFDGSATLFAKTPSSRSLYSESYYPRYHLGWSELRSVIAGNLHFIAAPHSELFDLRQDSAEKKNIVTDRRREATRLMQDIGSTDRGVAVPSPVSAEESAKLASLGYVSAAPAATGPLPDPKEQIADLARLKDIERLMSARDFRGAISRIGPLLAANPGWSDLRDRLGVAYQESGQLELAEKCWREAIRLSPSLRANFALSLADVLMREGRLDEAASHAALALRTAPAEAHQTLGMIALARRDYEAARREATLAREIPSERVASDFLLCEIDAAQNQLDAGIHRLDQVRAEAAAMHAPLPRHYWYVAADLLARKGRTTEAIPLFDREIAAEPENRQAYANLALIRFLAHDVPAARAVLERMVQANHDRGTMEFAQGCLARWGDRDGAARWAAELRKQRS